MVQPEASASVESSLERLRRAHAKRARDPDKLADGLARNPDKKRSKPEQPNLITGQEPPDHPSSQQRCYAVVVTALPDEMAKVETAFVMDKLAQQTSPELIQGIFYHIFEFQIQEDRFNVAVCCINEMGMVPAAIVTFKAIAAWSPEYVIMSGICAGIAGTTRLGDIIVAEEVFDYGSGKILSDGRLHPDYRPIRMPDSERNIVHHFKEKILKVHSLRDSWPATSGIPHDQGRVLIGSLASGAAVVANDSFVVDVQQHKRNLFGIDMEAFGVARAVASDSHDGINFLIAKTVSDHADEDKSDTYQEYCAFISAAFVREFIRYRFAIDNEEQPKVSREMARRVKDR